jgi:putative hydrolase of the HAD superfamily
MSTKWVILDVMGVIFEVSDDTNDLLVPYIQKRNKTISEEKINEMYLKASLGEISSFDFWDQLGFGGEYPEIEKDYLDTCLRIDPEFKRAAEKLAKNYSLAILSNDVKEWSDYLCAKFGLDELFKIIIVSGKVKHRKPDKRIYKILLDRIQSVPSDCVFVDDRQKNLRPASEIGIKTIRFAREESNYDFSADFEISSFAELPETVKKMFESTRSCKVY